LYGKKVEHAFILSIPFSLTRLPDGIFSNQKQQFRYIWEGLGMENCGIFHLHSGYFVMIWYTLWSFSIFCDSLVYFFRFGTLFKGKSGSPVH
jgi:hypothetical protein